MEQTGKTENTIADKINIAKFPLNATKFYNLDISVEWVKNLLIELNEKAEDKTPEEFLDDTSLYIGIELTKLFKKEYGEYLLLKANITTNFKTQCVRTLEDMNDSLELEINICFLNGHLEKEESFTDQMEVFERDEVYELYFYKKGFADINETIHEQIYLSINQYPVLDSEEDLDWEKAAPETKQ